MAEDPHIDREKKVEQAMVLLTLATEVNGVSGPCLGDEELAALVEGRGEKRSLAELWAHLGSCSKCYEEWLFLKKSMQQERPRGRLYRLSRLPKLRYLGTALAAAASIAVYLNVVKVTEKNVEQAVILQTHISQDKNIAASPPAPVVVEKDKEIEINKSEQAPKTLSVVPPAAPMDVGSGSAAKKGRRETARQSAEKPLEEKQKRIPSVPSEQVVRKVQQEPATDAALSPVEGSAHLPVISEMVSLEAWFAQLQTACLSGREEAVLWQNMAVRGAQLQALQPGGDAQQKLTAVVALVKGITGPDKVQPQCRLILDELAKKPKNR
jgi:hypothetical protein